MSQKYPVLHRYTGKKFILTSFQQAGLCKAGGGKKTKCADKMTDRVGQEENYYNDVSEQGGFDSS